MVLKQNMGYNEGVSMVRDTACFKQKGGSREGEIETIKRGGGMIYGITSEGLNGMQLWYMQKRRGEGTGLAVVRMGVEHKRADCQRKA